ncbi:helix-turn-helix domain-containing protein, partial [Nocardia amamiensis]|uniref:helix-turn-helix domain-containing protein n=1 Tax=Nocardia amamiensis TaxID=404578 RepID=UPI001E3E0522
LRSSKIMYLVAGLGASGVVEVDLPKVLVARPARDALEERKIRKLASARHAPGDWIRRARMITASWDGKSTAQIAGELGCHPQTVRERLHRFNAHGVDGLGDRRGSGRRPRLTETERSRIVALVATTPPGRMTRRPDGALEADQDGAPSSWTLDSLAAALRAEGIVVGRSQVRRILVAEGVRWRRPRSWTTSKDPYFVPKEPISSVSTRSHPRAPR